ncbi:MAG: PD-(D/E)XK nuclease domain-containing protein, partial [Prevotellaceae bacterium]|nr:PD-(D/E)XK nuclease domain-containing protein [Prevotellaceae bacterium]
PELAVVAEVKYGAGQPPEKLLEAAMLQIHSKKYYEAYADKKLILLAVAFSGRDAIGCRMEPLK